MEVIDSPTVKVSAKFYNVEALPADGTTVCTLYPWLKAFIV